MVARFSLRTAEPTTQAIQTDPQISIMGEETQQTLSSTLERARDTLSAVLLDDPNNRGQAKAWLISTVASLKVVPTGLRLACLDPCSSSSPLSAQQPAQAALLQLLMEQRQGEVAALLSADPGFLCSYFTATPANISRWFGHFSMAGIQHFQHGAKALANYALAQRSEVWHLLVWAGKHTQAPVAVAAKPHYFCELDVQRTVRALARDCPSFWESDELQRSCRQGTWLAVDPPLAAEELQHLLRTDRSARSSQLQHLLQSFLATADWALLCTRLLPLLPDQQLAGFVELLGQRQQQQQSPLTLRQWLKRQADFNTAGAAAVSTPPSALAAEAAAAAAAAPVDVMPCVAEQAPLLLGSLRSSWDLRQVLLATGLTSHRAQLLRLLQQDDDACSQLQQLATAAQQVWQLLDAGGSNSSSHQPRPVVERGVLAQLLRDGAPFDQPRQRLQLLLLGWLLRLQLLLGAADAAAANAGEAGTRMQQLLQQLGCSCSLVGCEQQQQQQQQQLLDSAAPQLTRQGQLQQQSEQQSEQQQSEQQQSEQQQQQQQEQSVAASRGQRTPLRRGPAAAAAPALEPGSSKPKGSSKSKKRRRRHSSTSISSGDDAASSDVDAHSRPHSSSKHSKHKRDKREKRKRRAKRRRRHSNSSSGECSEDLDAGGELLDPADASMQGWQQGDSAAAGGARAGWQPDEHALELLRRLARLSVGGQLWERPRWLLQLPLRLTGQQAAAGSAQRKSNAAQPPPPRTQQCVALSGTTAAVADGVACYWVWDVLSRS